MIVYRLRCGSNHEFEGWFKSMNSFERQERSGQVVCPVCGSTSVCKMPSSNPTIGAKLPQSGKAPSRKADYGYAILKKLSQKVKKQFEYVGERFPEEARKIHFKETEPKNIYGTTTQEEERKLAEEGIEFFKFPMIRETDD